MSSKNPIQLKRKEVRNAVKKTKSLPSNAASDDSRFKESSKEGKVRSANPGNGKKYRLTKCSPILNNSCSSKQFDLKQPHNFKQFGKTTLIVEE